MKESLWNEMRWVNYDRIFILGWAVSLTMTMEQGNFYYHVFSLGQMKCFTEYLKKGKAMASISVD